MLMQLNNSSNPTMTSREIADLVESRHDKVKQSIERLVERGVISKPPMGDGNRAANGTIEKLYYIGKRDSYVIVAQLSPEFTARLVDRWQALEAAAPVAVDLSNPEVLRGMLLTYTEKVMVLEGQIATSAPKVAFAEAVRNLTGLCTVEEIAKTIGWGRNRFIAALKEARVLQKNGIPYQKYLERQYFKLVEAKPWTDLYGNTHPSFSTRVTGAGQVWLAKYFPKPERQARQVRKVAA